MDKYNLTINSNKAKKLVKIFLYISFFISLIGILTLFIYNSYYISIDLYKASIIIFRTGLLIGVFSIIYGIFFSNINNIPNWLK